MGIVAIFSEEENGRTVIEVATTKRMVAIAVLKLVCLLCHMHEKSCEAGNTDHRPIGKEDACGGMRAVEVVTSRERCNDRFRIQVR